MIRDFVMWMYEDPVRNSLTMLLVCSVNALLLGTIVLAGNKSLSEIADIVKAIKFLKHK